MNLPCWRLQNAPEKLRREDSISYLGYKMGLQKIRPQKIQYRRDQLQTLNDYQRLLGDISQLLPTIGIKSDELIHLNKTLGDDNGLNIPKESLAET